MNKMQNDYCTFIWNKLFVIIITYILNTNRAKINNPSNESDRHRETRRAIALISHTPFISSAYFIHHGWRLDLFSSIKFNNWAYTLF